MAQPTTGSPSTRDVATNSYIGGSIREDLADFITQLSPEQTPYLSSGIGSNKAMQPRHDWQTDELDAADITNAVAESFEFSSGNALTDEPTRLSNYTQVLGKTIHVPGSLIKSNFAGAQDYYSYQRMKRGKEIMRDVELAHIYWAEQPGTAGANSARVVYETGANGNRRMGGLAAYARHWVNSSTVGLQTAARTGLTGNAIADSAGSGTGSASVAALVFQGDGQNGSQTLHHSAAAAATTFRPITEGKIAQMAQSFTDNNGMWTHCIVPTSLKASFSNAMIAGNGGAAQRRADEMAKKVNLAVDAVVTEFGFDVAIVPNYLMAANTTTGQSGSYALAIDSSAIKRSVLTPLDTDEDGTGRYGKGYIMFCDETIEVQNPNSVGMFTGLSA